MSGAPPEKARYLVTVPFTVDTPGGTRTFTPGRLLNLVAEKAAPLLAAEYIREDRPDEPSMPHTYGILIPWRTATGRLIYLAATPAAAAHSPAGTAAFQLAELEMLRGATPRTVNTLIDVKELFGNPTIQGKEIMPPLGDFGPPPLPDTKTQGMPITAKYS